jgi:phycocyanobilin:ferredoxin oxidoreductase
MNIYDKVHEFNQILINKIMTTGNAVPEDREWPWFNLVLESTRYRRAHIDTMDYRESHGLYMTHICIFPHLDNGAPIFGVDLVAGKKKVTGAFHDFSCSEYRDDEHPMQLMMRYNVKDLDWKRTRELPEWASNIFSPNMLAVSNINTIEELDQFFEVVTKNLNYYLEHVGNYKGVTKATEEETRARQNWYCENQRKNPHTPRVVGSLGVDPDIIEPFIETCLFPSI